MAKNVTFGFFDRKKPDNVIYAVPNGDVPENRQPIKRLSWHRYELPVTWEQTSETILRSSLPDSAYFLDSSFLDRHDIPQCMWDALLSRRIVFTSGVWSELEDWRNTPFANRDFRDTVVSAKSIGHKAVTFLSNSEWTDAYRASADYYISLLACRKLFGHTLSRQFVEKNGRSPTPDELTALLQSSVRDRGLFLATKGLSDHLKPNFLVDEDLVVSAILYAIITGSETTILTRDKDVLEQYYKAVYLLDTHYRSLLIASSYEETPENLLSVELSDDKASPMFESPMTCLHLPRRFTEWVLPQEHRFVNLYCDRYGGQNDQMKVTHFTFSAEREMAAVLDIKGTTQGRNSNSLDGNNCHLLISPPFPDLFGGHVAIAKDRITTIGTFTGPLIDANYAIMEIERFSHAIVPSQETIDTTSLGWKLATFRLWNSCTYSTPPEWMHLSNDDVNTAITYFDAASIFFVDQSFIEAAHDRHIEASLIARGFAVTSHISDYFQEHVANGGSTRLSEFVANPTNGTIGIHETSLNGLFEHGFGHYLGLLAYRKQFGTVIASDMAKASGRSHDFEECRDRIRQCAGDVGVRLAEDGNRRINDKSLYFNEEVLLSGLYTSIDAGADIVFVTKDPLMLEQYLKMCEVITNDYASFLYARRHKKTLDDAVTALRTPPADSRMRQLFESNVIVHSPDGDWLNAAWPKRPFALNLHCWLFGDESESGCQFTAMTFCIERPMHRLLQVKGRSAGRNLSGSEGLNARLTFVRPDRTESKAQIARDRIVPLGTRNLPRDERLDLRIDGIPAVDLMNIVRTQRDFTLPS